MVDPRMDDLWWIARQKSAAYRGALPERIFTFVSQSLPGKPTRAAVSTHMFGTAQSLLMVDLNKYRQNVNVEMLIDMGVRLFGLRVGGPAQWVYGSENYQVDSTFTGYYERIRKKDPTAWILGYGVHNPWSNEEGNYLGIDPQVKWLKDATRNHLCDLYCWDDEVGEIWKNGRTTTISATNLVKSIKIVMAQTIAEMEKWPNGLPKIPVYYGACWFMKKYALTGYQTWRDQAAADPANRPFLSWLAYLPLALSGTYTTPQEVFDKIPTPTGLQENSYLKTGSEPPADLWQCTFTGKGPWSPDVGIDMSISYGLSASAVDFARNANLVKTTPPPDTGGDDEQPPTELSARVTALEADVEELIKFRDYIKAA